MPDIHHSFKYIFWHTLSLIITPIADFCNNKEYEAFIQDWDKFAPPKDKKEK